jgi:alanine racemase
VCVKIWTEISGERLAGNFRALERILEDGDESGAAIKLLAVVKANAYGHGIDPCAAVLAAAGAKWLGVTDAHEGARVREALRAAAEPASQSRGIAVGRPAGEEPEILVMCGTSGLPGEAECIVRNRLTAVVWNAEQMEALARAAEAAGLDRPLPVHLEVDTGMSRQGAEPGPALDAVLRRILTERRIALDGVLTHFASTEVAGSLQTAEQQRRFEAAVAQVAASGLRPKWVHVGNSSYIDNETEQKESLQWLRLAASRLDARAMVRSGLALFGYLLPIEGSGRSLAGAGVLPVMTWKTRIIGLQEIAADARVGYNGTFVAERPMRLALLPAGYADGLRRELSSTNERPGGWVILRGARAPIIGRISMNLTTVDVSAIPDARVGDEVVLLGEGITADDHARLAGTIAYEILCGIKKDC